jgi:DNA-binding CsgD family transcriptional regulator/PAS domain-containing protein
MMCPRQVLLGSEFYNDFLQPHRVSHALGATLGVHDGRSLNLSVFRRPGERAFTAGDLQFLRLLMPHLQQVAAIRDRLQNLEARLRWNEDALDRLATGVVLVDPAGTVLFANRAAKRLLDSRDGIALERGRLQASTAALTNELRGVIARAAGCGGSDGVRRGGSATLPRAGDERPLDVVVSPLGVGADSRHGATAVLLVKDPHVPRAGLACGFMRLYRLTPAESRVAEMLVEGRSLQEIAAVAGTSLETVRTQLKQVLAKTGTRRQSELVGLLLRGAASDIAEAG